MKVLYYTVLLSAAFGVPAAAVAQEFPTRPVTLVIAFAPGGATDIVGRFIASELSEIWGQPVVVENRPGAGSSVGSASVARATPDGYTLVMVSASYSTNAAIQPDLTFDPVEDLLPVSVPVTGQFLMGAGPSVNATTVTEFLEEAQTREVFYGTSGVGSAPHFAAELFNSVTGLSMTPVHYGGGSEAMLDLVGGRIDVYFGSVTQMFAPVESGEVKPFGVTSDTRSEAVPDVPTFAESGIVGAEFGQWYGFFAPAGIPEDIASKINADITRVVSTPEAAAFLESQGSYAIELSVSEATELVHGEIVRWRELAAERGISAN